MMADQASSDLATAGGLDISIALATYNGARFLAPQLASIRNQELPPSELVVTDDGSTDDTVAILKEFAAGASFPVRIQVNSARLGYRRNFSLAAGLCTGNLIFFCDQDDVWLPHKTRVMAAAFDDPEVQLAYHGAALVDAGERRFASLYAGDEHRALSTAAPPDPWHFSLGFTQAFRANLRAFDDLIEASYDHMHGDVLAHDQWYFFLALALGKVQFIDEELVLYRQHGANAFGADKQPAAWRRLLARLPHDAANDLRKSSAAERRAEILRAISARLPDAKHIGDLADDYETFAGRLARRRAIYVAATIGARLAQQARSLRRGDYAGKPWAFDWRAIPRDFLCGVLGMGQANRKSRFREVRGRCYDVGASLASKILPTRRD